MNEKKIPENCNKCEYTRNCYGAYGHLTCKYHKEILEHTKQTRKVGKDV